MEFNLTKEQKITAIELALIQAESTLYQTLLHAGIDPSTFDETSHSIPEGSAPYSPPIIIAEVLEKINSLKELKSSIENA